MRQTGRRRRVLVLIPLLPMVMLAAASGAAAHVTKVSGPFRVEMGWGNEPPLTGLDNFVDVRVSDASGAAVAVPAGALSVEVTYGDAGVTLPLVPDEQPGRLRGELVPTRPGTYAFHVTGTVQGRTLDVRATCSEATFECVNQSSDVEFPVKDPSTGELAQRLTRESDRVEQATDRVDSAKRIAIVAIAIAAAALGLAALGRRKSSES
jgi:hypothetical protein